MFAALNNAIVAIDGRLGYNHTAYLDKNTFMMTILLSIPDEKLERNTDCIGRIKSYLDMYFLEEDGERVKIVGHDRADNSVVINEMYVQAFFLLQDKEWLDEAERTRFAWLMLFYPFLAKLYEIYGSKGKVIFEQFWDKNRYKETALEELQTEAMCEKQFLDFLDDFPERIEVDQRAQYLDMLLKGYFVKKVV